MFFALNGQAEVVRVKLASVSPINVEIEGTNLKIDGKKNNSNQIILPKVTSVTSIYSKNLRINKSIMPNNILLWPKDDKIDLIAVLELENYLEGVLPHEMPASWPKEALKAQAIASRSYALALVKEKYNHPYHLNSTVDDQIYRFQDANLDEYYKKKIHKIISETKGLVLKDEAENILRAYYHSDCGGRTESPNAVWDNGVENNSATDDSCAKEKFVWNAQISTRDLEKKMAIRDISNLKVIERSKTGRVQNIVANSSNGNINITGQFLREKVGFGKLKSTLFSIVKVGDKYIFNGKGFGHGVGMCQMGSRSLAALGKNYTEILSHYFPTSKVEYYKNKNISNIAKASP